MQQFSQEMCNTSTAVADEVYDGNFFLSPLDGAVAVSFALSLKLCSNTRGSCLSGECRSSVSDGFYGSVG